MRAAIIAIGTEVTSGEIINANSSTLAARLTDLGIPTELHLAVADDRSHMEWAFKTCIDSYELVITTGGLGPTTDDFTRDVIATVAGHELTWDEGSWNHILTRLQSVNAPIAESNKRQAWFPAGATIFPNQAGTAAAFAVTIGKTKLIALPGPPLEINSLWATHVENFIKSTAPGARSIKPRIWKCLGLSESKLGELVEAALEGSGLTTGYRSHQPFIDVKVWMTDAQKASFEKDWRHRLEKSLEGFIVARDNEDLAAMFWNHAPLAVPMFIIDRATGGYLAKRLNPINGNVACQLTVLTCNYSSPPPNFDDSSIVCTITENLESGAWQIVLTGGGPHKSFSEVCRYRGKHNQDRLSAYVAEKSLLKLIEWFK
jgi:molybdenum cofactor synthesis domain-containing protein